MKNEPSQTRIALQIPTDWKRQFQAIADERQVSLSDVIRGIILDHLLKSSEEVGGAK